MLVISKLDIMAHPKPSPLTVPCEGVDTDLRGPIGGSELELELGQSTLYSGTNCLPRAVRILYVTQGSCRRSSSCKLGFYAACCSAIACEQPNHSEMQSHCYIEPSTAAHSTSYGAHIQMG